ncbi:phosphate ABC transporter ATP-binding protein PstB [Treponema zuelzerae]|uniref:Phosphate ABC transporter ATP-binding protein PstB n=1 Tax=Teretinema zuelzerae TaxID=156 RepID=A0AAE3EL35_9SPIR|nr:phosphate ABC transporter ATP-binding protein PstB [Teretinema zuelzerae]MCD1655698.1 phosphate ABC transporter ATP-binding protein PstB [Teretinema zuelzerae]HPO01944.1 phosphate ABC transporter ATP-binding protein PstB [Treponemataceae bacterium]
MCNPETNETAASTVQAPLVKTPSVETPASDVVLSPWAIETRSMNFWYGNFQAVIDLDMKIERNRVTAIIGPSGCGKSTALRTFNRMNDLIPGTRVEGEILFNGRDMYGPGVDPVALRSRIGMVFQKPNPFPKTIRENIIWGARINGFQGDPDELVETSLRQVYLWDEVKDKLKKNAYELSGGQQQRLCIARAIAVSPEILLMDEPTSALDPISTGKIEDLMTEFKERFTIIIVTHNMQQAGRISDDTAFFLNGILVEMGPTREIFFTPKDPRTENYISGRFG